MTNPDETMAEAGSPSRKDTKKGPKKEEVVDPDADLSDEDLDLKKNLELLVERICDPDETIRTSALESVRKEIREATTSMTSVPKPLKFLKPHYDTLKKAMEGIKDPKNYSTLADVISIMASTCAASSNRETLKYRLLGSMVGIGNLICPLLIYRA